MLSFVPERVTSSIAPRVRPRIFSPIPCAASKTPLGAENRACYLKFVNQSTERAHLILVPSPARVGDGFAWLRFDMMVVCPVGGGYGALRGAFHSTSVAPILYLDGGSVDLWDGPWLHGCHVHPITVPSRFFESSGRQIFPAYLAPKSTRSVHTRDLRLE